MQNDGFNGFAQDAFSYSLDYFAGDYIPKNIAVSNKYNNLASTVSRFDLFNGNIKSATSNIYTEKLNYTPRGSLFENAPIRGTNTYNYRYDQLNRLKSMVLNNNTVGTGNYATEYSYDFNGNLITLNRNDHEAFSMDRLQYQYGFLSSPQDNNQLKKLVDNALYPDGRADDIRGSLPLTQSPDYLYDEIGNLIRDENSGIASIEWNQAGKVVHIVPEATDGFEIRFVYDGMGNRIMKHVYRKGETGDDIGVKTIYLRDAQGNPLATYRVEDTHVRKTIYERKLILQEHILYGSDRLGIRNRNTTVASVQYDETCCPTGGTTLGPSGIRQSASQFGRFYSGFLNGKQYELKNHLGNVMTTISDGKLAPSKLYLNDPLGFGIPEVILGAELPTVVSASDYYPFGMVMPGRQFQSASGYRYGFNGMEKDDEIKGSGNSLDFGARIYDPRLGRWMSLDPLAPKYPGMTPYNFVANNPVKFVDLDGRDIYSIDEKGNKTKITVENYKSVEYAANFEGMLATASGAELFNKYVNSSSVDIFITVGSTKSTSDPDGAAAKTIFGLEVNSDLSGGTGVGIENGRALIKGASLADYGEGFAQFEGVDASSSAGKKLALIVLEPESVSKKAGDGTFYQDALKGVEIMFHEMKAHVEGNVGSENQEHKDYGSTFSIFSMSKVPADKPVGKFTKELSNSKLKMPSHTRQDLKSKVGE